MLHLRSRRFSSDAAVYNTIAAFSLLLCALQEPRSRPAGSSSSAAIGNFHVPAHCAVEGNLGRGKRDMGRMGALSRLIEAAVAVLEKSPVARLVSILPGFALCERDVIGQHALLCAAEN